MEESESHRVVETLATMCNEDGFPIPSEAGCSISTMLSALLSKYWLTLTTDRDGKLAHLLPRADTWTDQVLVAGNENAPVFALARITSALDGVNEASDYTALE